MLTHLLPKLTFPLTLIITAVLVVCLPAASAANLGDELYKLTASDAATGDSFGQSVGVTGNFAIVGSPFDDDDGINSGSAYLFDVMTGGQLTQLIASDAAVGHEFGFSVAVSGNVAIVGAPRGNNFTGSAYLFDVTTGQELFKLTASDAVADDQLGASVAISGNMAIVGAWADDDAGPESGSAYLFDVTTGQQLFKLTASDAGTLTELFGFSVAISGNTAIVGAPGDNDAGTDSGSAYLFDVTTGQELFKLTAADAAQFEQFGVSVGISGNVAIVGLANDNDVGYGFGSAYLFDVTTGQELFKLVASDAAAGDHIHAVAISDNIAIVGSPQSAGSAYLFDVATGGQLAKLTASDAEAGDNLGFAVAVSGNTALVGAPGLTHGNVPGSAYVFSTIPEPASLALLALGLPLVVCRHLLRKTERRIP